MKEIKYLAFMLCAVMMASSCDLLIDDEEAGEEEEIIIDNGDNNGDKVPSNDNNGNQEPSNDEPSNNDEPVNNEPQSPIDGWTIEEVEKANTAGMIASVKKVDKDIIMYCNLARMDGARFWTTIAKPFLGSKTSAAISSLKTDLEAVKDYDMLMPEKGLFEAAQYHGEDMRKNDYFAHQSLDGTATFDRVARFYTKAGSRAENIAAGNSQALAIVMQWLVDANTASLGHRKSILGNQYKVVGVYTCEHPSWRWVTVQDFGSIAITPME